MDDDDQVTVIGGGVLDRQLTKARESRILIIRNTVIITVQQKKRPHVLVRLPLVHRLSCPSALQPLKLFCLMSSVNDRPMADAHGEQRTNWGVSPWA